MDIVVTVPKNLLDKHIKKDYVKVDNEFVKFWSVPRRAKALNVGDRVYFVENGYMKYYYIFLGYVHDPICEVTGRIWPGLNLLLKCPEVTLDTPVEKNGFQGFRYL
jgi:hypothetical protein